MEPEDMIVYESNVAYQANKEFIQYKDCKRELVPPEAGSSSKTFNELKFNIELLRVKKLLIIIVLLVVVLVAATLTAIIFSALSYKLSRANNESLTRFQLDERIQEKLTSLQIQLHCGAGQWHRIAFLNMSDPSQQCPSAWREYNTSGVRACGRMYSTEGSCSNLTYGTGNIVYSRVCGQVIGYQVASPDAFNQRPNSTTNMDGIILGIQQYAIWRFVAGVTESSSLHRNSNCPCSPTGGWEPPSQLGSKYYCESGNPTDSYENNQIFYNDPVWDGQKCEGTCCTGTDSPPWFSVQLPAPTTDMIEVSICADESTDNEDTPIKLLEIYVQ
jgi:hypothetical protein